MAEQRFCKPQVVGSNPSGGYQERGSAAEHDTYMKSDPGLARVVEAWSKLDEAIRAGIVAMVSAAAK